jgi:putative ABC transport system permease protein
MTRSVLSALLSHWRRKPMQLAMLLLGLSLATALWSGVQAINAEARAAYADAAGLLGRDRTDRLVPAAGATIPADVFARLRRAGWAVSPVLEGWQAANGLTLIGIDPLTAPAGTAVASDGTGPGLRDFLDPKGVLLVSPETAARLSGADLPKLFATTGIPPMTAIGDIGLIQTLLDKPGAVSHFVIDPAGSPGLVPLADLTPDLARVAPQSGGDLARLTDSFHLNLTAFGALAFVVGLFIAHAVIGLVFEQRRATLRTLRALGVPLRLLVTVLAFELGGLALVAGLGGVVLGYLIAGALLPDVASSLRGLYGADVPGSLTLRAGWVVAALALTLVGTLAAAATALWQAATMPVLAPAMPRAWARASDARLGRQGLVGLALVGLAAILANLDAGLISAFALVAAILVGTALILPWCMSRTVQLFAGRAKGPVAQWFWADTSQQLPGLSLALMALLLALASNIGVGTMVSSFRLTFTGWLDQRLASEIYLTARDPAEAAALLDWVRPRVDSVLPITSVRGDLGGQSGDLYGVADHATYRDNWPMLSAMPEVWDQLARGEVALINEQMARRGGFRIGDRVALPGGALPVGGVYSDYGNPRAQALISATLFAARFPEMPHLRFGLRMDPASAGDLVADLATRFSLPQGAVVMQSDIKSYSLQVFERTFLVTGALNILTLGVACVALFSSLLTLAEMRLPQLAPVWSLGLTRRRLAAIELMRIVVLAALTLALAVPLGLVLAWALLARVNVAAFGWQLPMEIFPQDWGMLALTALPAAALAALWPALRLMRLPPAALLRIFANERG